MTGKILDLFCGCGGLSLGAHYAGFASHVAIDVDSTLSSAYRANFPRTNVLTGDLASISPRDFRHFFGKEGPIGVIGGPPCQGFSSIGKRDNSDPRNSLLIKYFEVVQELQPKFFVMENVPGLLLPNSRHFLDTGLNLVADAYSIVGPITLNASNYGAATDRKRIIIIGYKSEYMNPLDTHVLIAAAASAPHTTKDAIYDLGEPSNESDWQSYAENSEISSYAQSLRSRAPSGLGDRSFVERQKIGLVSGFSSTRHSSLVVSRFSNTKQGEKESVSRFKRLAWNKPANVLRAGTGADKGSFQSARPIHPDQPRVITVREAARIQGFPDWFSFHPTKWHSHRMIGNSVPPPFSHFLFKIIAERIGTPAVEFAA
ncbi:DNA cytosine methyltransferase [Henriciella litoralis]|uniref:DNA cytosine methyltransferase n=1 Tax=Henriciella litoralis TaxID=568102 RepID=UPI0009FFC1BA|nr:DNA cytosine methyltransferase [Henriciella litoralis]